MKEPKYLTKKHIKYILECPGYIIDYLNDCGRLPLVQRSSGKGVPNLYHPNAVEIIRKHLNKSSK